MLSRSDIRTQIIDIWCERGTGRYTVAEKMLDALVKELLAEAIIDKNDGLMAVPCGHCDGNGFGYILRTEAEKQDGPPRIW